MYLWILLHVVTALRTFPPMLFLACVQWDQTQNVILAKQLLGARIITLALSLDAFAKIVRINSSSLSPLDIRNWLRYTAKVMNFIKQLQQDLSTANADLAAKDAVIQEFKEHLASSKFVGVGNNYINTCDVNRWIEKIWSARG